jgi:uncharacterized membrane protein (UPF0127 family)
MIANYTGWRSRLRSLGPAVAILLIGCVVCCDTSGQSGAEMRNDLDAMTRARMTIDGNTFEVWIADDPMEQTLGLMQVTAAELAPTADGAIRGMLFVFPRERELQFTMRNTIVSLDIAFMRDDGEIVTIHTMPALDNSTYSSEQPARYALEVPAGTFGTLGISEGDRADLPGGV